MVARAGTFSALKHRNFRLFLAGQAVSLSGTWMQRVAESWLVYELTKSPLALGIIGFATRLPVIFLSLFAGVLADRLDKRKILIVTQTVAMCQAFVLAALTFTGVVRFWHVAVLGTLLGVSESFDTPARQSFYKEMVGAKDLMNAIALNSTTFNLARMVGPAIAGVLIASIGVGGCFLFNALSFLAVIVAYLSMRLRPQDPRISDEGHWSELKEGLRYVRSNPIVSRCIALIGVASLFAMSYSTLLPVFATSILKGGARTYTALMAAAGAGALTAALVVASLGDYRRKGLLASLGAICFPLAVIGLSFAHAPAAAFAVSVVLGMTMILLTASLNTLVQTAIPDRLRGRVMSLYILVFFGAFPFGNLLAGRLAESLGVLTTLRLGAGVSLAVSSAILLRTPELPRFRA
jgi:MFS family permease